MYHTILPIYGPFAIHGFGLMIACGILIFTYLVQKQVKKNNMMPDYEITNLLIVGICAAVIGGRLFFIISNMTSYSHWYDCVKIWEGRSSLGCILAAIITTPLYLHYRKLPILPLLDLFAIYAPILHAMGRLGCFLAGCCYGVPSQLPWAIMYTDQESIAPLYQYLHPTQLYSACVLFGIFVFMHSLRSKIHSPGMMFSIYLFLINLERFSVDFFRGDKEFFANPSLTMLSLHQWISLLFIVGSGVAIFYQLLRKPIVIHEPI